MADSRTIAVLTYKDEYELAEIEHILKAKDFTKEELEDIKEDLAKAENGDIKYDDVLEKIESNNDVDNNEPDSINNRIEDIKEAIKEYIAEEKAIVNNDKYSNAERDEADRIANNLEYTLSAVERIDFKEVPEDINDKLDAIEKSIEERDDSIYIDKAIDDMMGKGFTSTDTEEAITSQDKGWEGAINDDSYDVVPLDKEGNPDDNGEKMIDSFSTLEEAIDKIGEYSDESDPVIKSEED